MVEGAISSRKGAYQMKHQPYFNNPRVKLTQYTGVPRNRAERRAMAKKSKGRQIEALKQYNRLVQKTQNIPNITFKTEIRKPVLRYQPSISDKEIDEYDQQQIANLKKAQANLKRAITRAENKNIKEYLANTYTLTDEQENAIDINTALDYAESVHGGFNEYGQLLKSLMKNLLNDDSYQPGKDPSKDDNEYFKIDPNYTGKTAELFKYVTFKKIPDTYLQDIEAIEELPWSSEENYQERLDEINKKIYTANVNEFDIDIDPGMIDRLFSIMQSSAAWHIASKWTNDSEQAQAAWESLYRAGDMAFRTDADLFDAFVQMVRNEAELNDILTYVDDEVYKALKE